jgi:hypothetical protein
MISRLLGGELVLGEDAGVAQLAELLEPVERVVRGCGGRRRDDDISDDSGRRLIV